MAARPTRAASARERTKIATGASRTIQPRRTVIASETPRKNAESVSRGPSETRLTAAAKRIAKSTSGRRAPSAAARKTFAGRRFTTQSPAVSFGVGAAAAAARASRNRPTASGPIGSAAVSGGTTNAAAAADSARRSRKSPTARPPSFPTRPVREAPTTATTRPETTSGRTVIRIALTQRVPAGSRAAAAFARRASLESDAAVPRPSPAASATRTWTVSERRTGDQAPSRLRRYSRSKAASRLSSREYGPGA